MNGEYHIQLCRDALGEHFSTEALTIIGKSNTGQDSLSGLFLHPEYHYEHLEASKRYIQEERGLAIDAVKHGGKLEDAWRAFGRLLHATQDFYAHTNYVRLWAERFGDEDLPPIENFDGLNNELHTDQRLYPCKTYLVRDYLYFVPFLKHWIVANIPADSHARMNLDNPEQGPLFNYAMEGARQASRRELQTILDALTEAEQARFLHQHAA
jgi:hypothetical protein